jgi:hypothetical protein
VSMRLGRIPNGSEEAIESILSRFDMVTCRAFAGTGVEQGLLGSSSSRVVEAVSSLPYAHVRCLKLRSKIGMLRT